MSDNVRWPAYSLGSDDHLHAIGVLIAAWNLVEVAHQILVQIIFPHHLKAAVQVCELLGVESEAKLIRAQLPDFATEEEMDRVEHFLKCTNTCREYRNIFAHAGYSNQPSSPQMLISRGVTNDRASVKLFWFDVGGIREMADATHSTASFGMEIGSAIQLRLSNESWASHGVTPNFLPSLPDKPPLPRKWDQIPAARPT